MADLTLSERNYKSYTSGRPHQRWVERHGKHLLRLLYLIEPATRSYSDNLLFLPSYFSHYEDFRIYIQIAKEPELWFGVGVSSAAGWVASLDPGIEVEIEYTQYRGSGFMDRSRIQRSTTTEMT